MCYGDEFVVRPDVQHADQEEFDGHDERTEEVDVPSAHVGHEIEPVDQGSDEGKGRPENIERICGFGVKTDLFEEIRRVVGERQAREDLACERHACDFCPAEFESGEAVPVGRPDAEFFFEMVGMNDRRKSLFDIDCGRGALEAAE